MAEQKPSLLSKLVKAPTVAGKKKGKAVKGKMDFVSAMTELGHVSVFDIVRQPKGVFVEQLGALSDADGEQAYESALCYASQIAWSWRREQVSSGRKQPQTQRTGIRSLVDVGPSYSNLFNENWDEFCAVGAIAAVDSPVAYLNSLYSFIKQEIEKVGTTAEASVNIPLDVRRPDLQNLVLDEQSTFTPFPMLDMVQQILSKGIRAYVDDTAANPPHPGKGQSIYQLLKEKRHPFQFPYDFHHHQLVLGLSGKNTPAFGELSYAASENVPIYGADANVYGRVADTPASVAQCMLTGLSPEQQSIISTPTIFPNFYITRADLENLTWWHSSSSQLFCPWLHTRTALYAYVVPEQPGVVSVVPAAQVLVASDATTKNVASTLTLKLSDQSELSLQARLSCRLTGADLRFLLNTENTTSQVQVVEISKNSALAPYPEGVTGTFHVLLTKHGSIDGVELSRQHIIKQTFCISLIPEAEDDHVLRPEEAEYLVRHYGVNVVSTRSQPLISLGKFMAQTELNADQVDQLIAFAQYRPRASANFKQTASGGASFYPGPLPQSMHYGASYVNGTGGLEPGSLRLTDPDAAKDSLLFGDCSIGRMPQGALTPAAWVFTNLTLERLDRLQRMVRLQRWLQIPFAELDTLIMGIIHSERDSNLGWELNANTLRGLGVFRHLSKKYPLEPEEFAAFVHFVSPFSSGERLPLFDRVFNSPALFDTPLLLDAGDFSVPATDVNSKRTLAQLAAGLGLMPEGDELQLLAENIKALIGTDAAGGNSEVGLKRLLPIISSFYRQARIARMFGLSVRDSHHLIGLLGGLPLRTRVVRGWVRPLTDSENTPDILDILMQMDWAVTWLREISLDVPTLLGLLGMSSQPTPSQALIDQLNQLAVETRDLRVTEDQVLALGLPLIDADSTPINWWTLLCDGDVVSDGLISSPGTALAWDPGKHFEQTLVSLLLPLKFDDNAQRDGLVHAQVLETLIAFCVNAYNAQHRLMEGFLQANGGLSMAQTEGVLRWSGLSLTAMLTDLLTAIPADAPLILPLPDTTTAFVDHVKNVIRYAEMTQFLSVSAVGLRTFIQNKTWLDASLSAIEGAATLTTFYLLDRYTAWVRDSAASEEQLLAYLLLANQAAPDASVCAALLADSIGWTPSEVQVLTAGLTKAVASNMAQVDWVRRVQTACLRSGLSAAAVLGSCTLTALSTPADWQAAGEAAMAASH